jgi:hypothetical protein
LISVCIQIRLQKKNPVLEQKYREGYERGMENGIELGKESAIYYFASRFDNLDKVKGIGPKTIKLVVEHCGEQYFKTID